MLLLNIVGIGVYLEVLFVDHEVLRPTIIAYSMGLTGIALVAIQQFLSKTLKSKIVTGVLCALYFLAMSIVSLGFAYTSAMIHEMGGKPSSQIFAYIFTALTYYFIFLIAANVYKIFKDRQIKTAQ